MNVKPSTSKKLRGLEPCEIYEIMQLLLLRETATDQTREQFWTIALDADNRILNIERVSLGSLESAELGPAGIFGVPLLKKASGLLLLQFCPGGEFSPGEDSIDLTDRLIQAGHLLQLPVLDHVLVSGQSYYSFAHSRLLRELENNSKYLLKHPMLKERQDKMATEQAKAIGENNRTRDIARAMKKSGAATEYIMEVTGLSRATIAHLKTEESTQNGAAK